MEPIEMFIFLIMLGAILGSFLNVIISRCKKFFDAENMHDKQLSFSNTNHMTFLQNSASTQDILIPGVCADSLVPERVSMASLSIPSLPGDVAVIPKTIFQKLTAQISPTFISTICYPRSHCPNCKTTLRWRHNIPILSYLWLHGRCYFCQQHISIRYLCIEIFCVLSFLICAWHFHNNLALLGACLLSILLITLAAIDYENFVLPDILTQIGIWLGLLWNLWGGFIPLAEAVLGAVVGYCLLYLIGGLFKTIRRKFGLGHGDYKLLAMLGAWVGVLGIPVVLFYGSVMGLTTGLLLILFKKSKWDTPLAFGPFLAFSGWLFFVGFGFMQYNYFTKIIDFFLSCILKGHYV